MVYCRETRGNQHPNTPDVHQKASKRAFDGQVKKWRRMLHAWDLPGDAETATAETTSAYPQAEPKNGQSQRQAPGLPLKMPSAIRPANKRSRSFLAALLSPTMAPKESKVQRKVNNNNSNKPEGEPVAQEESPSHPSQALMNKWRTMATVNNKENELQNDTTEMIDDIAVGGEEVSYSEDEDEALPMQTEPMTIVA